MVLKCIGIKSAEIHEKRLANHILVYSQKNQMYFLFNWNKNCATSQLNHGIFHKRHPFTFTNLETKVIAGKNWDLTA